MQIVEGDEEEPLENGDSNHELTEQTGQEQHTEEHEEQNGEEGSQEEAVVVDADSTDGAVLEADKEWVQSFAYICTRFHQRQLVPALIDIYLRFPQGGSENMIV